VFSLELVVVQIEGALGYVMPTIGQQDGNYIVSIDLTGQKEPPILLGDKVGRILALTPGWLPCSRYEPKFC